LEKILEHFVKIKIYPQIELWKNYEYAVQKLNVTGEFGNKHLY